MPLENATYIDDLNTSNPAASDGLNNADDHMRLIKLVLKNTLPGWSIPVTATPAQLNALFASQFLGPDGTALLPAWTFASQPSMGIRRSAAGLMEIVGGTLRGNGAIPAGAVMDFAMTTAPTGWYALDGQTIAVASDPDLFAAIGYTWGGAGASFILPNALSGGRFRRHRDNSTFSGIVGTYQSAVNKAHTHRVLGNTQAENAAHSHAFSGQTGGMNQNAVVQLTTRVGTFPGSTGSGFNALVPPGAGNAFDINTNQFNMDHVHSFSGQTGSQSTNHAHGVDITSDSSGDANESRPNSMTMLTCIKR